MIDAFEGTYGVSGFTINMVITIKKTTFRDDLYSLDIITTHDGLSFLHLNRFIREHFSSWLRKPHIDSLHVIQKPLRNPQYRIYVSISKPTKLKPFKIKKRKPEITTK